MTVYGETPDDKMERILKRWGMVLAYREAGGAGYPCLETDAGPSGSDGSGLMMDFLTIERALSEIQPKEDAMAVRIRAGAEYSAYARGESWTVRGWRLRRRTPGSFGCSGVMDALYQKWRRQMTRAWFGQEKRSMT
jgi:hypothetical protein